MPQTCNTPPDFSFISVNPVPSPETPFHRLQSDLGPTDDQRMRMLAKVRAGMTTAQNVRAIRESLEPDDGARIRVWNRISEHIAPSRARGFLEQVRAFLTPDQSNVLHLGRGFLPAMQPVAVPARPFKWVAAFAIVIVALRASPLLFLAPQTIAQSSVFLRPTRGDVFVSFAGLSQQVAREVELEQATTIHTVDGEGTVLLHDDGTIRLGEATSVTLLDVTDRPAESDDIATLTLAQGTVWIQGLVPDHLRGISVQTPAGLVTVHGGSVSVSVGNDGVVVEVWDRHARLEQDGDADIVLVAGERLTALIGQNLAIATMSDGEYDASWPSQNLQRDAVHQRAVAQEQRERIAARAGILPTSRLYPVKRIAENIDVLLTFDRETAVKKRVAQATTRLNEATTLLSEGESGATIPLQEYQVAMLQIANGSGDTLTQQLVEATVAENAAQLGAQLPSDDVYAAKKLVLDTSVQLPGSGINEADVEASVIGDTVDALQIAAVEGDREAVESGLETLAPFIADLPEGTELEESVKKEVLSRLVRVADALNDSEIADTSTGSTIAVVDRTYTPLVQPVVHLTQDEINTVISGILDRVFTYSQYTGQTNQLRQEVIKLQGHPDEGMILRALYDELEKYETLNAIGALEPDFRLSVLVRGAIRELREERGGEVD